jgi:hypothetical protein
MKTFFLVLLISVEFLVVPPLSWAQDVKWTRQFGTEDNERVRGLAIDREGHIYIAGDTDGIFPGQNEGGLDGFISKHSNNGEKQWTRQFGTEFSDLIVDVGIDGYGYIYLAGYTFGIFPGQDSAGDADSFLLKYNSVGELQWTRQFGTKKSDRVSVLAIDSDGSVYLAGDTSGVFPGQLNASFDVFLRKYNSNGEELWTRQFATPGDGDAMDLTVDKAGYVYVLGDITGSFTGQGDLDLDIFLRKYNSEGEELWAKQFGSGGNNDDATSITLDRDENLFVAGETDSAFPGQMLKGDTDAFVIKYSADGKEQWTRQFGTDLADLAVDAVTDDEGNIYLAGYTFGNFFGSFPSKDPDARPSGGFDVFVSKFNGKGENIWIQQFGSEKNDRVGGMTMDQEGNIYIAGDTDGVFSGQTSSGGSDVFLSKLGVESTSYIPCLSCKSMSVLKACINLNDTLPFICSKPRTLSHIIDAIIIGLTMLLIIKLFRKRSQETSNNSQDL